LNLKKILQFSIGPIGAAGLSLITLPFIAWFFSVEDVGRLTMLQVVLGLSVSLFSLAMHQAYVREYHEEEDKPALLKLSVLPGLLLLTLVCVLFLILPFSISEMLFGIDSSWLTVLLFIGVYASYFINFLAHVIRMQERGIAFSATQVAPKAFLLILIGFVVLLNITAEFKILMLMNTFSIVISLYIFSWLTKETWIVSISRTVDRVSLVKMLKFSLPLVAGGLAYWGLTTMDRFFLRDLAGFDELGVYALSVSLAGAVSIVSTVFSNIWHPVLYKWIKEGIDKEKLKLIIDGMTITIAFIWSFTGAFSFLILPFFPPVYAAMEYLIVACVSMPLFYMLSQTTGVGIGVTRRSAYAMIASVLAFITNAILNYFFIPVYGASGAALATLIAFFVFFTIRTEASVKLWCSLPRLKVYIIVITYIIATITMVLSKAKIDNYQFIWLVLFLLTCFLFFKRCIDGITFLRMYLKKENHIIES
jgi:O-antigen/teichoic acid export membrane protein